MSESQLDYGDMVMAQMAQRLEVVEAENAQLREENEQLRANFGHECADIDEIFAAIGWGVEKTRTECGLLRVASLKYALRNLVAPGDGG